MNGTLEKYFFLGGGGHWAQERDTKTNVGIPMDSKTSGQEKIASVFGLIRFSVPLIMQRPTFLRVAHAVASWSSIK